VPLKPSTNPSLDCRGDKTKRIFQIIFMSSLWFMVTKKTFIFSVLREIYIIVRRFFRIYVVVPPIKILSNDYEKISLGSSYGVKLLCKDFQPPKPFVISGGVGEDISFDVELIELFDAEVILVDPTPKSKKHFDEVVNNLGNSKKIDYGNTGKQSVETYELGKVNRINLRFHNVALWENSNKIALYPPADPTHSSYSVNDLQKTSGLTKQIEVDSIDIKSLLKIYGRESVDILKLDIEGAEYEVLRSCFEDSIFPGQIIVEIDEMCFPSISNYQKSWKVKKLLSKYGYKVVGKSQEFDYCLVRK
jgi:FkbM family methyltransferase